MWLGGQHALQRENQQLLSDNARLHGQLDGKSSELAAGSRSSRAELEGAQASWAAREASLVKDKEDMAALVARGQERAAPKRRGGGLGYRADAIRATGQAER